jgi:hypothetical protein
MVRVLNAFRLPSVEEQIGSGVIRRITVSAGEAIYWVDGFACGRSARVLRPMEAL